MDLPDTLTVCLVLRMDAGFNQYLENPENQQRPEYDKEYWQAARPFHDNTTKLPYYIDMIEMRKRKLDTTPVSES